MNKSDSCSRMINEGINKIGEIYYLSESLPESRIRELITQTVILAKKIYNQLELKPEYISELTLFHNYFMDSASIIIFKYCDLILGKKAVNISEYTEKMESVFSKLKSSFQTQLNSMFSMDILKFNTEIEVLMKTLKSEEKL
ncbi:MAG: 5-bromo-4-chloroindolyl phosphate hydrolysis family protein [Spirochaetes bacterium]|nr:5-bromo-4-chloroindolyl phosphate hydrolysis family protein [Spirochaetota bacterium]